MTKFGYMYVRGIFILDIYRGLFFIKCHICQKFSMILIGIEFIFLLLIEIFIKCYDTLLEICIIITNIMCIMCRVFIALYLDKIQYIKQLISDIECDEEYHCI